jgi:transcriptional regulator with XRE-family HTH domain
MYDSEVLNKAIKDNALSNEKVAVAAGLAARTISKIRNGDPDVRLPSLEKTAGALGFDVEVRFIPKTINAHPELATV